MPHEITDHTAGDLVVTALGCLDLPSYPCTKRKYLFDKTALRRFLDKSHTSIILSGSQRMMTYLESFPKFGTGLSSSFNVFPWFTTPARKFDPFLLNDLWTKNEKGQDHKIGATFDLVKSFFDTKKWDRQILSYAKDRLKTTEAVLLKQTDYFVQTDFDGHISYLKSMYMTDKVNIVYAHLHYLANAYPNKTITYQLVDYDEYCLFSLSYFYNTHPELVPRNSRIQFVRYDRLDKVPLYVHQQTTPYNTCCYDEDHIPQDDVPVMAREERFYPYTKLSKDEKALCTIQGIGPVDKLYRQTVKYLSEPKFYKPLKHPVTGKKYKNQPTLELQYFSTTIDVARFIKARDALAAERIAKNMIKEALATVLNADALTAQNKPRAATGLKLAPKAPFFKPASSTDATSEASNRDAPRALESIPNV